MQAESEIQSYLFLGNATIKLSARPASHAGVLVCYCDPLQCQKLAFISNQSLAQGRRIEFLAAISLYIKLLLRSSTLTRPAQLAGKSIYIGSLFGSHLIERRWKSDRGMGLSEGGVS